MKSNPHYQRERLRIIFEYSPIAIWEEDFSALAKLKATLKKLKVKNVRQYLMTHRPLVIQTFRKLKVLDVNRAAVKLYGAKSKHELLSNLGRTFHKDVLNVLIEEFTALLQGETVFEAVFKSRTLSGRLYDVSLRVAVPDVYKDSFKRVVVTLQDISVQKKYERHLRRLAQTDGLTKVLNHNAIRYRLEEEFTRAKRYHLDLSCMMIDFDNFKEINDRFGHQKGDAVLKRMAVIFKQNLREVDVIGRYGGDEFLVILPETPPESARIAAKRICDLSQSLVQSEGNRPKHVTVSIGVGGRPSPNVASAKDLLTRIDKALYSAKRAGRSRIVSI